MKTYKKKQKQIIEILSNGATQSLQQFWSKLHISVVRNFTNQSGMLQKICIG